ncbi:unnamed protein product [Schistosoma turkestanicum]|nr:unnamed protein product [Schistosoma turkestanicum]
MSLSNESWRRLFIICNCSFVIFSIVVLAISIGPQVTLNGLSAILNNAKPLVFLIASIAGGLGVLASCVGVCGYLKQHRMIVYVNIFLLCLVTLMEIGVAVNVATTEDKFYELARESLNVTVRFYTTKIEYQMEFDKLQTEFQCCGAYSGMDYKKVMRTSNTIPKSCDEKNWNSQKGCITMLNDFVRSCLKRLIGTQLFIINPALGDRVRVAHTETSLLKWWSDMNANIANISVQISDNKNEDNNETDEPMPSKQSRLDNELMNNDDEQQTEIEMKTLAKWTIKIPSSSQTMNKMAKSKTFERHRIIINVTDPIISLDWHPKGDYLLTLSRPILASHIRSRSAKRLLLHRLSKMSSQTPFTDTGKPIEWKQAGFHPTGKPHLFIASPRAIRIYDLMEQKELRCLRLESSSNIISCMAIHPSGDHLVVGSYDSRFNWFDIELGNVPFKKLQLNHGAVRQLAIHHRRPLVSVALSDGTILIIHGKVIDDLLSKPIIIPVQLIRTGQPMNQSNVFSTVFHPCQPYVYSGGEDGSIKQFVAWK